MNDLALKDALYNELMKKNCIIKTVAINPASVAKAEFLSLKEDVLKTVLSKLDGYVLIRIQFECERFFETHKCEYTCQ